MPPFGPRIAFWHRPPARRPPADGRLLVFRIVIAAGLTLIAGRLFVLQVLSHDFYAALASDQHSLIAQLFPERGTIYLTDPGAPDGRFPAAVNKSLELVYADARLIENPAAAAKALAPLLELDEAELAAKLAAKTDPYVPLQKKVSDDAVEKVRALNMLGIGFAQEQYRFYPEKNVVGHLTGFLGSNEAGEKIGQYGVEGHWNRELAGATGFLETEKDPFGRWIGSAERNFEPAQDGDDIVLTVDRNIQYFACGKLKEAVAQYGAVGGALAILNPQTGAVLALCGVPDFDPNDFGVVEDPAAFSNPATFLAYEPGSVFKPITMASAIDAGRVLPNTTYEDTGSVKIGPYTIKNSDGLAHGVQTMTQVLEKSLNTGAIFAADRLGAEKFLEYVKNFGFGWPTGIEIDSESPGNIASLYRKGDIWSATASYGQGIMTTPLQLAAAFGALANNGKLMKPFVVAEIRSPDGTVRRTEPTEVRQVVSKRAATLVGGMLVRVIENGHGKRAGVPGYYVAGKTGTAQISRRDGQGYEADATIGSFVGFAPVDDPAFVMAVKIERPQDVQFAESTAAPLFGEIAKFLLQYMQIPPERPLGD